MQIFNKRKQTGGMLIETIAGVAILGAVAIGAANLMEQSANEAKAAAAAQQLKTFGDATSAFIKQNQGAILNLIKQKRESGIDDQPVINITPVELINAALLPAGFNSNNSYGQQTCALVTEIKEIKIISGVPTEVPSGRLSGLVITENTPSSTMDEVTAATIANMVGANGGRVITGIKIAGARNAWNLNALETAVYDDSNFNYETGDSRNCAKGTNNNGVNIQRNNLVLALWLGNANGSMNEDVLYRVDVPGMTHLNDMQTTLGVDRTGPGENGVAIKVLNGNVNVAGDTNVTGNLKAKTLLATYSGATQGGSCSEYANGTLATSSEYKLFSCISGAWHQVGSELRKYMTVNSASSNPGQDVSVSCNALDLNGITVDGKLVSGSCSSYKNGVALWSVNGHPTSTNSWHCPKSNLSFTTEAEVTPNTVMGIQIDVNVTNTIIDPLTTAYAICEIPN